MDLAGMYSVLTLFLPPFTGEVPLVLQRGDGGRRSCDGTVVQIITKVRSAQDARAPIERQEAPTSPVNGGRKGFLPHPPKKLTPHQPPYQELTCASILPCLRPVCDKMGGHIGFTERKAQTRHGFFSPPAPGFWPSVLSHLYKAHLINPRYQTLPLPPAGFFVTFPINHLAENSSKYSILLVTQKNVTEPPINWFSGQKLIISYPEKIKGAGYEKNFDFIIWDRILFSGRYWPSMYYFSFGGPHPLRVLASRKRRRREPGLME